MENSDFQESGGGIGAARKNPRVPTKKIKALTKEILSPAKEILAQAKEIKDPTAKIMLPGQEIKRRGGVMFFV